MEIFVVGVESDVVVVFGEFVGVALDELYEMRVVVWFDTEGNDFIDGQAHEVVGFVAEHSGQIFGYFYNFADLLEHVDENDCCFIVEESLFGFFLVAKLDVLLGPLLSLSHERGVFVQVAIGSQQQKSTFTRILIRLKELFDDLFVLAQQVDQLAHSFGQNLLPPFLILRKFQNRNTHLTSLQKVTDKRHNVLLEFDDISGIADPSSTSIQLLKARTL